MSNNIHHMTIFFLIFLAHSLVCTISRVLGYHVLLANSKSLACSGEGFCIYFKTHWIQSRITPLTKQQRLALETILPIYNSTGLVLATVCIVMCPSTTTTTNCWILSVWFNHWSTVVKVSNIAFFKWKKNVVKINKRKNNTVRLLHFTTRQVIANISSLLRDCPP